MFCPTASLNFPQSFGTFVSLKLDDSPSFRGVINWLTECIVTSWCYESLCFSPADTFHGVGSIFTLVPMKNGAKEVSQRVVRREMQSCESQSAGDFYFHFFTFGCILLCSCWQQRSARFRSLITVIVSMFVLLDWLDDVELAGVLLGSGGFGGFIRWFTINANTQCTVGPDRPAGVS